MRGNRRGAVDRVRDVNLRTQAAEGLYIVWLRGESPQLRAEAPDPDLKRGQAQATEKSRLARSSAAARLRSPHGQPYRELRSDVAQPPRPFERVSSAPCDRGGGSFGGLLARVVGLVRPSQPAPYAPTPGRPNPAPRRAWAVVPALG